MDRPSLWSGTLTVAAAAVIFGTSGLFVKALGDLPFVVLLAGRFAFASLAFVLLAAYRWRRGAHWQPKKRLAFHYVALGAGLFAITTLFFAAILRIGMGLATLLLATAPAWIVLVNWAFWHVRPRGRVLAGLVLGLVGVALVLPWDDARANGLGIIAGVASGLAHAIWMLVARDAGLKGAWGETQAGMSMLVVSLVLMPVAAVTAPRWPTFQELGPLLALALGPGMLSIVLLSRGLRQVDAARAGVLLYGEPLTALALGVLVLNEALTLVQVVGAVLALVGMGIVTASRRRVSRRRARKAIISLKKRPKRRPDARPARAPGEEPERGAGEDPAVGPGP